MFKKNPDSLIDALDSADPREREKAANALIAVRDPRAEVPLFEVLGDPDPSVRGQAALAIGSLGSRRAVPRLLELTQDPDWFVRVAALNGLGYIDPGLPAEPALAALSDDEPFVRQAAALNIARLDGSGGRQHAHGSTHGRPRLGRPRGGRRSPGRDRRPACYRLAPPRRASLAGNRQLASRACSSPGASPDRARLRGPALAPSAERQEFPPIDADEGREVRKGVRRQLIQLLGLLQR